MFAFPHSFVFETRMILFPLKTVFECIPKRSSLCVKRRIFSPYFYRRILR